MNKANWGVWTVIPALTLAAAMWGPVAHGQAPPAEMPVRGGSIVVKVAAYEDARRLVLAAAQSQGAEMLGARTLVDAKGHKHGWLRLRLPATRLPLLLASVGTAGKLYGENVTTTDYASEYEELARRITRLREHEARLSGILGNGRRLRGGDLLYVQERLFRASVDESLLAQRRADLERNTQVNTLMVELFEPGFLPASVHPSGPASPARWFPQALALARTHLNRLLARGITGAAYALVYAPLWLPALLAGLMLLRALWRRRRSFALRMQAAALQAAASIRRVREAQR